VPVGIDIDRGREIYITSAQHHLSYMRTVGLPPTVDGSLEGLAADLALQVADARFLLDGHRHGMLVVAE